MRTVYVLSNLMGMWHLHRHSDDEITPIAEGLSRIEVTAIAMKLAREDRPSRVIQISKTGEYQLLAEFGPKLKRV